MTVDLINVDIHTVPCLIGVLINSWMLTLRNFLPSGAETERAEGTFAPASSLEE